MGKDIGTIQVTDLEGKGPYIYKAHHLHMHSPAEHKFNGVHHDLEMHIVHELVGGVNDDEWENYKLNLAVVGILFKKAEVSHPFVEKMRVTDMGNIESIHFSELFNTLEHQRHNLDEINDLECFHYQGSLTTPPMTDIVNWNVYRHVLPISEKHLNELIAQWNPHVGGHCNFREVQPLYGRRVVRNFQ